MDNTINEFNKPVWSGVKESDQFNTELFYPVEMHERSPDTQIAFHSNLGTITVLDRETGYGGGMRDVETGYRDKEGNFWLASCDCDVTKSDVKTFGEAIEWIKKRANTCVPKLEEEE